MFNRIYFSSKKAPLLGAIALSLSALLLPACDSTQDISEGRDNVTTEDLATAGEDDINSLVGQMVTVRSPVQETLDANSLVMQTEAGDPILVFSTNEITFTPPDPELDIPIQATGEVVQFVTTDIENEYGIDLDDELYVDYEQQPAILVDSLALAPPPEVLAANAEPFYDQVIAVEGDAGQILSPNTFAIYEEGWVDDVGLLVVGIDQNLESQNVPLEEGEQVVVTGMVQPFDVSFLQQDEELGWTEDEINEFASRYTNRPVIVADEIYPSAID